MDNTICDFATELCQRYNSIYDTNIKPEDIKMWNLSGCMDFPKAQKIYNSDGFFYSLKPYLGAVETLKKLNKKHNIVIATKPETIGVAVEKYRWLEKYTPFIPFENITMTGHKHTMNFDVMIDDNVEYLESFKNISICYNQPYNKICRCDYRVHDWENVEWTIKSINKYYKDIKKRLAR